jgi:hypothetical protein
VKTLWSCCGPEGDAWFSGSQETLTPAGQFVTRQARFTAPEVGARTDMRVKVTAIYNAPQKLDRELRWTELGGTRRERSIVDVTEASSI